MSSDPLSQTVAGARAMALFERGGDLALLGGLLADARAGEGRLAVIEGPAGIGKTRLLEEARAAADGLGLEVLHARGGELERDFGFGVVRQLLEPRVAVAGERERACDLACPNKPVSKTVVGLTVHRGFESLPLRCNSGEAASLQGLQL